MTRTTIIPKERLAAFADGELSPEEAAAIVMHLADHPGDQAYVDEVIAANVALARAFSTPMHEPLPHRLAALLSPESAPAAPAENVIRFPRRISARLTVTALVSAGLALAAAVTAVAFLLRAETGLAVGPIADGSALHRVLAEKPSGETVAFGADGTLTILSSLPAKTGHCREFEMVMAQKDQVQIGLACQDGNGWVLDVLLAETLHTDAATTDGYAPASGDDVGAIDRWLDRRGAGAVLSPAQEAARIAAGWASQADPY